jgi:hypothetical protein
MCLNLLLWQTLVLTTFHLRDLLKGCYISRPYSETNISALFWDVTQRRLLVSYQSFRENYRFHLEGSCSPRRANASWTTCTLKVGPIPCHETSVTNYQSTLHNIPEERGSYLHRGGDLKPGIETNMLLITRSLWMLSNSIVGKRNCYTMHSFGIFKEKKWGKKVNWISVALSFLGALTLLRNDYLNFLVRPFVCHVLCTIHNV